MIMELEERHRDKRSTIKWCEFRFSSVQRKSSAVFMLQLETAAAAEIASVEKLRQPHSMQLRFLWLEIHGTPPVVL